jgi:hypothetical protein
VGKLTVSIPRNERRPLLDGSRYHQYEVIKPLPVWHGGIAGLLDTDILDH